MFACGAFENMPDVPPLVRCRVNVLPSVLGLGNVFPVAVQHKYAAGLQHNGACRPPSVSPTEGSAMSAVPIGCQLDRLAGGLAIDREAARGRGLSWRRMHDQSSGAIGGLPDREIDRLLEGAAEFAGSGLPATVQKSPAISRHYALRSEPRGESWRQGRRNRTERGQCQEPTSIDSRLLDARQSRSRCPPCMHAACDPTESPALC